MNRLSINVRPMKELMLNVGKKVISDKSKYLYMMVSITIGRTASDVWHTSSHVWDSTLLTEDLFEK